MKLRALLVMLSLGLASFAPSYAADNRPQSSNPNVKRAMRKAKKVRPAKYKTPNKNKKQKRAKYTART
jgi:hypothetical protein